MAHHGEQLAILVVTGWMARRFYRATTVSPQNQIAIVTDSVLVNRPRSSVVVV